MNVFTAPQRKALESAAKTGNAWNAWGNVYRTSTNRMMQALCARGLLTHDGRPTDKTAEALGLPVAYGTMSAGSAVVSSGLGAGEPVIVDKMVNTTGRTLEPGTYTVGVSRVEQVCGRIERTIDIGSALDSPAYDMMLGRGPSNESGESFLANSARQLGIDKDVWGDLSEVIVVCSEAFDRITQVIECDKPNERLKALMARPDRYVGRDLQIEFAHGPADADPRTLDFSPIHEISGTLEVVWDALGEPFACGPVHSREFKWFAGIQVLGASPAFPNGFSDVIYFPMRKGIKRIVVRRKAK